MKSPGFHQKNKEAFYTSKFHKKTRFFHFLVKFMRFTVKFGLNLVNFQNLMKDLVKKPGEFTKFFFGENFVKFQNLVKTW